MTEPSSQTALPSLTADSVVRDRLRLLVLVVATALGFWLCYLVSVPFLPALTWALTLAILMEPCQRWLESKIRSKGASAGVSVILILSIVAIPGIFIGQKIAQQAIKGAALVEAQVKAGEWRHALTAHPRVAAVAASIEAEIDLPAAVNALGSWLSTTAAAFLKGSVYQVVTLCLTFYLLFFFLRDRAAALASLQRCSPLDAERTQRILRRVQDTVHATIYGSVVVAVVQGSLGGLMLWWLDVPAPFLWGVVMTALSIVPMLGAYVVWAPVAAALALQGNLGKAVILTLWGTLFVGTIDNLLRPLLMGKRLGFHTVQAFIAVVGGLILFGPAGLILGPLVLTLTLSLVESWREGPLQAPLPECSPLPRP